MRTEKEMLNLILNIAKQDKNIKAVCMNGSRVNVKIQPDIHQDFDIVYIVENLEDIIADLEWINQFGNRIITQFPEAQDLYPSELEERYPILMLFDDYNRIDLTLLSKNKLSEYLAEDKLIKVLLDKDNLLPKNNSVSEASYWISKPYQKLFDECINEYYWVSTYVMKGIWRNELLYSIDHLNICRRMLLLMLAWDKGYKFDFQVNFGKSFKYLPNYLGSNKNSELTSTYPHLNTNEIKEALYKMTEMFEYAAVMVSKKCKLNYDTENYAEVKKYIGFNN
ncbi:MULTISPECIES: aminoglycoside 6-adenylyltransferase [Staphylococcus]|nr:aminoglycoside 6-adenylyltransferase [Staphylococcus saprophyticus]MDW3943358.1 aminoglycoside 6-adenylyltransferase [Staphylococcus saprophyticus]MDW3960561.1 aminoglycoside 6-adenylyltransferase [Staphylococcus saprophyticus]MDW3979691.1 aminoglycoside 6-adenylyltransferase [Staphylococcus saprophyticus]OEK19293.1 aminoglycoside adenylyltransferase [Staphylococcus saprophyticus]OEK33562.1 aminoglycoside adenylyltransferase [Staphylococcus saprophyticus]